MKTSLSVFMIALLAAAPLAAQEPETLLGADPEHGGFGGPVLRFSSINSQFGLFLGGHGGWVIGHRLMIGGGGYGLVNQTVDVPFLSPMGGRPYLTLGYGGLELQYVIQPMKLVHGVVYALVGGGGADYKDSQSTISSTDGLFIFEPGAALVLNLSSGSRISVGATYRLVREVSLPGLTNGNLSGFSGFAAIDFGRF